MLFVAVAFVIALAGKNLSLSRFFSLYLGSLIGVAMTFLGLNGRLHWLFVLLGPTLPFLGSIFKWASRLWGMGKLVRRYRG
ncbi:MAG: hypothetical protein ACI9HY_002271 [Planctomycetaceae bacterium]|jgi:hypothetical protein